MVNDTFINALRAALASFGCESDLPLFLNCIIDISLNFSNYINLCFQGAPQPNLRC